MNHLTLSHGKIMTMTKSRTFYMKNENGKNNVGKGENAGHQHFSPFPIFPLFSPCFQKDSLNSGLCGIRRMFTTLVSKLSF